MKKSKKYISSLLVVTLITTLMPTNVFASEEVFYQPEQIRVSDIKYETVNQYGVLFTENQNENKYDSLTELFKDTNKVYESADGMTYCLDLSAIDMLNIPDLDTAVEISNMGGEYYSISYYTTNGEFVVIQYLKDGTTNCAVREKSNSDEEEDTTSVINYNGKKQVVNELNWSDKNNSSQYTKGVKTIEYPTPKDVGFRDTGSEGKVSAKKSLYISALGSSQPARVVEYESDYKKVGSGWLTFGANTSLAVVAAKVGWGEVALANFLTAAGLVLIVVDGVKMLQDAINLPKYSDYTATDGKYGDIYDVTVHKKYCRVVFNTGISQYIGGLNPNGEFIYAKKDYQNIKSDSEIFDKIQNLYNSCLVVNNGYNECYGPV